MSIRIRIYRYYTLRITVVSFTIYDRGYRCYVIRVIMVKDYRFGLRV